MAPKSKFWFNKQVTRLNQDALVTHDSILDYNGANRNTSDILNQVYCTLGMRHINSWCKCCKNEPWRHCQPNYPRVSKRGHYYDRDPTNSV